MVAILAKVKVREFPPWLETFRKYADKRADFGCRAETVYRAGSGDVFILFDWSSEQAFGDYMGWLRPQALAARFGLLAPPEHTVLGERAG